MERYEQALWWAGGALVSFWLGIGPAVDALLLLMVLDVLTGLIAGYRRGELDSHLGWLGMGKKMITLAIVSMAAIMQPGLNAVIQPDLPFAQVIAGGYAAIEALSILENADRAGVPTPRGLRAALLRIRDQAEIAGPTDRTGGS